ncbi:MAG: hypothetical protein ACR2FI_04165 [Burkholderiales bacterium]
MSLRARKFEQAIEANERGIEINPAFLPCLRVLVVPYTLVGHVNDARRARDTLQKIGPARRIFTSTFFHDPELASRYEHDRKMAWKDLEGAQE